MTGPPPDWMTLRILLAAIELGSIARAAGQCGIAVSAAAKRLQALEAAHGLALLRRDARGVRPTPAGEALARHARALLDLSGRMADDMAAFAAGGRGSVRLHATPSAIAGQGVAAAVAVAAFGRAHPGIIVELQEDNSAAILHDLAEGRADLGWSRRRAGCQPGWTRRPGGPTGCWSPFPPGIPSPARPDVAFAEVLDGPLIGVQLGGALAHLLARAAEGLGRQPRYRFRVASMDAARCLVAAGCGAAVMPDGLVQPYAAALGILGCPCPMPGRTGPCAWWHVPPPPCPHRHGCCGITCWPEQTSTGLRTDDSLGRLGWPVTAEGHPCDRPRKPAQRSPSADAAPVKRRFSAAGRGAMMAGMGTPGIETVTVREVGPRDGLQMGRFVMPTAAKLAGSRRWPAPACARWRWRASCRLPAMPQMADAAEVVRAVRLRTRRSAWWRWPPTCAARRTRPPRGRRQS